MFKLSIEWALRFVPSFLKNDQRVREQGFLSDMCTPSVCSVHQVYPTKSEKSKTK